MHYELLINYAFLCDLKLQIRHPVQEVIEKFGEDCEAFSEGKYDSWQQQPYNCLAGILIGDQLTRNVYRDSAKMYVSDDRVLAWAKALVVSLSRH